jgi:hypothetical protein
LNVIIHDTEILSLIVQENVMTKIFREFASTYEQFKMQLPKHPLVEELRGRISRGRFPSDQWLAARTKAMRDLMKPVWDRAAPGDQQDRPDQLDVA